MNEVFLNSFEKCLKEGQYLLPQVLQYFYQLVIFMELPVLSFLIIWDTWHLGKMRQWETKPLLLKIFLDWSLFLRWKYSLWWVLQNLQIVSFHSKAKKPYLFENVEIKSEYRRRYEYACGPTNTATDSN